MYIYMILSIGYVISNSMVIHYQNSIKLLSLELVVWLVPHLLSSAISVAFVGFFLGPVFPIVMNHAGGVLPTELIAGAVGWMASFGSAGAAVFPFVTGAIAAETSIESLLPL